MGDGGGGGYFLRVT